MIKQRLRKFYKRHKKFSVTAIVILSVIAAFLILPLTSGIPRVPSVDSYDGSNRYITFDNRALISAHRAGASLAPENTLAAFKLCMENPEYLVDILEFDLHLTADKILVLLHDDTLDRTSNAVEFFGSKNIKASEKKYSELRGLNMAENFQHSDGSYPYRGLRGSDIPDDIKILSLDEVLLSLSEYKTLRFIIEIKNGGALGEEATDILYKKLLEYGIIGRSIVGTFNGSVSKYLDEKYPKVTRSAGISEVLEFYFSAIFNVDWSKKDKKFSVLQIPYKDFGINLGKKSIIDYAHKYDIAVQYWTINNKKDIEHLVAIGADAIITDDPETAYKVIFSR